jgi:hypothetical protein
MAHKKSGGSTSNGRDSNPKMRGVKKFGGEAVETGMIIVRQKGTKFHPGVLTLKWVVISRFILWFLELLNSVSTTKPRKSFQLFQLNCSLKIFKILRELKRLPLFFSVARRSGFYEIHR